VQATPEFFNKIGKEETRYKSSLLERTFTNSDQGLLVGTTEGAQEGIADTVAGVCSAQVWTQAECLAHDQKTAGPS